MRLVGAASHGSWVWDLRSSESCQFHARARSWRSFHQASQILQRPFCMILRKEKRFWETETVFENCGCMKVPKIDCICPCEILFWTLSWTIWANSIGTFAWRAWPQICTCLCKKGLVESSESPSMKTLQTPCLKGCLYENLRGMLASGSCKDCLF